MSQKCNTPGPVWKPQFGKGWKGKWWLKTLGLYVLFGSFVERFLGWFSFAWFVMAKSVRGVDRGKEKHFYKSTL